MDLKEVGSREFIMPLQLGVNINLNNNKSYM